MTIAIPMRKSSESTDRAVNPLISFIARASVRERLILERQIQAMGPPSSDRGRMWERFLIKLGSLAVLPPTTAGVSVVNFFRPDGKYRQQVFSLEHAGNDLFHVFMPDIFDRAIREGVFTVGKDGYCTFSKNLCRLLVQPVDSHAINFPAHLKGMTGWNRKAIRVSLSTSEVNNSEADAVDALAELAACHW